MISSSTVDDINIIKLQGDIDANSALELDKVIQHSLDKGFKRIMVDAVGLTYISSAGLGVFMSYFEIFKSEQIAFVTFGLSEKVFQVFEILGIDKFVNIMDNYEKALTFINEK